MTKYNVKATNPATGLTLNIHGLAALSVDDAMNRINDAYPGYKIEEVNPEGRQDRSNEDPPGSEWPQNLENEDLLNDYRASLMLGSKELTETLRGEILRRMSE